MVGNEIKGCYNLAKVIIVNFTLPNLYIAAGHFDWWYVRALMARTLVISWMWHSPHQGSRMQSVDGQARHDTGGEAVNPSYF